MTASVTDLSPKIPSADLKRAPRALLARFDKLLAGRFWLAIVVALSFAISLLASFPTYDNFHPNSKDWKAIERIGERPFDQEGLDPVSDRSYNFTFRVTVPIIGGVLGLPPAGFMVLQGIGGLALFAASALVVDRVTGSRRLAGLAAISTGLMWAGSCAFVELRGNFDAVAIAFLVGAMATRKVPLIVLFTFLAAWTDERAIPMIAMVVLFHHVVESTDIAWTKAFSRPQVLAGIAGVVLHFVTRAIATAAYDVSQPSNLGASYIKDQINIWPMGLWTGLEGMWIFVALGALLLWKVRQRLLVLAYLGLIGAFSLMAIGVVDVTRSMAYLLPAAFVGIAVVARLGERNLLHRAMYSQFALTAIWPVYYAGGANTIYWSFPLPLVIIRKAAGIG